MIWGKSGEDKIRETLSLLEELKELIEELKCSSNRSSRNP